jgi:protease-4
MINDSYQRFVSKVADNRKIPYAEVDRIARGRVWNGNEGIDNGLLDMIGGMDEAIKVAKLLAGIEVDANIKLIYYPRSRSILDQYLSRILIFSNVFNNPLDQLEKSLEEIQMKPLMLMPFTVHYN